jgi:hypothetical protein
MAIKTEISLKGGTPFPRLMTNKHGDIFMVCHDQIVGLSRITLQPSKGSTHRLGEATVISDAYYHSLSDFSNRLILENTHA